MLSFAASETPSGPPVTPLCRSAYLPKLQQQLLEVSFRWQGKRINRGWIAFNSGEDLLRKNWIWNYLNQKIWWVIELWSKRIWGDQKFASVENMCSIRKKVVDGFGHLEMMKYIASKHRKSLSISGSDDTTVVATFPAPPRKFSHQDSWSQAD